MQVLMIPWRNRECAVNEVEVWQWILAGMFQASNVECCNVLQNSSKLVSFYEANKQ